MSERPIIFSAPMVRAILAGTKTQTRRLVTASTSDTTAKFGTLRIEDAWKDGKPESFEYLHAPRHSGNDEEIWRVLPRIKSGDALWVRETWGLHDTQPSDGPNDAHVYYRATEGDHRGLRHQLWRPSIFMPRWASRLSICVTAVRCERLQEIQHSPEDLLAEGISEPTENTLAWAYKELWDSLNAKRAPWASNPFVWVVEFERLTSAPLPVRASERPC